MLIIVFFSVFLARSELSAGMRELENYVSTFFRFAVQRVVLRFIICISINMDKNDSCFTYTGHAAVMVHLITLEERRRNNTLLLTFDN